MTAPIWLNDVIRNFGLSAHLDSLALNERGAAAISFESGVALRLEYTGSELVVAMTIPAASMNHEDLKRLLSISHPEARFGFQIRTGLMPKSGAAVMAVRLAERDVTLPQVNAVFSALWRLASEIGGASWT